MMGGREEDTYVSLAGVSLRSLGWCPGNDLVAVGVAEPSDGDLVGMVLTLGNGSGRGEGEESGSGSNEFVHSGYGCLEIGF